MNYNFITGSGRSGTTSVAKLLQGFPQVEATHEYIGSREYWLLSWYIGANYSDNFLELERNRIENSLNLNVFIDVNGYLQYSVPSLQKVFQPENILHLIRDPRQVIRSVYSRRSDKNIHLLPKDKNEIMQWLTADKFYQVCWNWADANNSLMEQGLPLIKFEKIVSDFEYCKKYLFEPLNISMHEKEWQQKTAIKANTTKPSWFRRLYSVYRGKPFVKEELPEFKNWPSNQKEIFGDLCGSIMNKAGYTF